jgi:hypothetical protein
MAGKLIVTALSPAMLETFPEDVVLYTRAGDSASLADGLREASSRLHEFSARAEEIRNKFAEFYGFSNLTMELRGIMREAENLS